MFLKRKVEKKLKFHKKTENKKKMENKKPTNRKMEIERINIDFNIVYCSYHEKYHFSIYYKNGKVFEGMGDTNYISNLIYDMWIEKGITIIEFDVTKCMIKDTIYYTIYYKNSFEKQLHNLKVSKDILKQLIKSKGFQTNDENLLNEFMGEKMSILENVEL